MPVSEYKGSSSDSGSFEYKFPFRSNNNKWQRTSSSPQQSLTASPQPHTPNRAISLGSSVGKTLSAERLERGAVIPRSVSSDGRPLDTKRFDSLRCYNLIHASVAPMISKEVETVLVRKTTNTI